MDPCPNVSLLVLPESGQEEAWPGLYPGLFWERPFWSLTSQVNREDGQTGRQGQCQPGARLRVVCRPLPGAGLGQPGLREVWHERAGEGQK